MRRDRYTSYFLDTIRPEIKDVCHGYVSMNVFLKTLCHYSTLLRHASLYITFGNNSLIQHVINHESFIACNTNVNNCLNKSFQTMYGYRFKWLEVNCTRVGSRKRHLILIVCGGDIICFKYVRCFTLRSFNLKTLMITHDVGTHGFLERVYFLQF